MELQFKTGMTPLYRHETRQQEWSGEAWTLKPELPGGLPYSYATRLPETGTDWGIFMNCFGRGVVKPL
ncbi:MAG TPA: hypothetical protein DEO70_02410 [Bacteroidales bacterium]|nr:MAG: hypothetical protein A2X11_04880 [Bacteroidetes bacterium GWE2_42_24]HBZ65660.1 hypothetical protein [Bacteroidales bacterium]